MTAVWTYSRFAMFPNEHSPFRPSCESAWKSNYEILKAIETRITETQLRL